MKSLFVGLAALLGVALVASPAEARPKKGTTVVVVETAPVAPVQVAPVKGNKVKHQHKGDKVGKINKEVFKQAVKDGRITKQESQHLRMQKMKINQMKQAAASDGVITEQEKRKLAKAKKQFEMSKQKAIHNDKTRQ